MTDDTPTTGAETQATPREWHYDEETAQVMMGSCVIAAVGVTFLGELTSSTTDEDTDRGRLMASAPRLRDENKQQLDLIGRLIHGIEWWAAQEDGIPSEVAEDYVAARGLLNWEYTTEHQRQTLADVQERRELACREKRLRVDADGNITTTDTHPEQEQNR